MTKVYLLPKYRGVDNGDGGIRRVVEAQHKYLGNMGIEFVDSEAACDIVALHAGMYVETDKPIVTHCHGLYWKDEYQSLPLWARKLNREVSDNIRKADIVSVPSKWVAQAVSRAFWVDCEVVGHGVEIENYDWIGNEAGYCLWNKTRTDSVCTTYEIEELARRVGDVKFVSTFGNASENLTVVGRESYQNGIETLRGASVYLATAKETFGIGILEAMALGIPVLGWDWGGASEIITHEETGWLCRPGDFDALEEGLRYCLESGNRHRIGANARQAVLDNYRWERRILPYAELYNGTKRVGLPGVSVIIPCYNLGRFLERAVDSAVKCGADEIIIVDDASTDETLQVANQLVHKYGNVRLLINATNQHVSASRNRAISEAKYEYIITLDADDYLVNIAGLKKALDDNRGLDIAYGAVQFVDEGGTPVAAVGPNGVSGWPFDFRWGGPHTFPMSYCPIVSMFRKKVWERVGGYRERYRGVEDADFYTRALSVGCKAAKVDNGITFVYTMRRDSLSNVEKKIDWTAWYPKSVAIPPEGDIKIGSLDPVLVSVVIPVGPGHERLVLDALDSVWAQTFEKWECIVVNDSGRGFAWLPSWVKVIEGGNGGKGPTVARNMGLDAAVGKYVYFLDADDYLQLDCLEKLVEELKSRASEAKVFVYSDWYEAESGRIHESVDCVCEESLRELLCAINILVEREALKEIRFDESIAGWEDWDFVLQLHRAGYRGERVDKPLFNYRLRSGSRREAIYARREEFKVEMYQKWEPWIKGEKKLACGSCGGGRRAPAAVRTLPNIPASSDGTVLVEYVGTGEGTRTFTGKVTGTKYRFGNDSDHKVKLVFKEDAAFLISLSDLKEFVGGEMVQLSTS